MYEGIRFVTEVRLSLPCVSLRLELMTNQRMIKIMVKTQLDITHQLSFIGHVELTDIHIKSIAIESSFSKLTF